LEVFKGDIRNITEAYINAIHKYHNKIQFIGHICQKITSEYIDINAIVKVLNQYNIPIEIDCSYLSRGKTNLEKLDTLLSLIEA